MISSSKKLGAYEKELLNILEIFFERKGFKVHKHVQLNISWGNIISDVDFIVESENQLFGIEVKSRRDNLNKLVGQINRMFDYFDGVYVATDNPKWMSRKEFSDERIGILIINGQQVAEKPCRFTPIYPNKSMMSHLRKNCLIQISAIVNGKTTGNKRELISVILANSKPEHLRKIIRSVITCERRCSEDCPLWMIEKQWITPIRNMQAIIEKYSANIRTLPLVTADFVEPFEDKERTNNLTENEPTKKGKDENPS
jgi:hypothetical protein